MNLQPKLPREVVLHLATGITALSLLLSAFSKHDGLPSASVTVAVSLYFCFFFAYDYCYMTNHVVGHRKECLWDPMGSYRHYETR